MDSENRGRFTGVIEGLHYVLPITKHRHDLALLFFVYSCMNLRFWVTVELLSPRFISTSVFVSCWNQRIALLCHKSLLGKRSRGDDYWVWHR